MSLRSSENCVYHCCPLERIPYRALCIIREAPYFFPNCGPAMIYCLSDVLVSRYAFPMSVVHISSLFDSARNHMILSHRSETNPEYTLSIGMSAK